MSFSERTKTIALAIVKIFETAKPFGNYSAVAVLKDGAGISYGTSQFTHRSGSLGAVIKRYERITGSLPLVVESAYADLAAKRNITGQSKNESLKAALRKLGKTPEMQQAQREIAFENYLKPALEACEGSEFVLPLSLAVIYDSINHGSYGKIRDRVTFERPGNGSIKPGEFEREWITQYVRKRDSWLENHSNPLLQKTDYRTDFFLAQIARENWQLKLPLNVNGHQLTEAILFPTSVAAAPSPETENPALTADDPINSSPSPGAQAPPIDDTTQAPSSSETTIKSEAETPGGSHVSIEQTNKSFNPDTIPQYIPKMKGVRNWFGTLSLSGVATTAWAAFNDLPPWAVFTLGMVTMAVLIGFAFVAVKYRENLFDLVKHVVGINADPNTNNIELTSTK